MLLYSEVLLTPTFAHVRSRAVGTLESINTTPHSRKDAVFGGLKEATNSVQVMEARLKSKGFQHAGQMGGGFTNQVPGSSTSCGPCGPHSDYGCALDNLDLLLDRRIR